MALRFRLAASTVRAIDLRYLQRWQAGRRKRVLRQIGIDEIHLGKKTKFVTTIGERSIGKYWPASGRAKAGSTIWIYNDDVIEHTIADDDSAGWTSQRLRGDSSIAITFANVPFEFTFHCTIHPTMKGKVIVE